MIIKRFENKEFGIMSVVAKYKDGYRVMLIDDDSKEIFPNIRIYPLDMKDKAIETAKKWANYKRVAK